VAVRGLSVVLMYAAPDGEERRFDGWWGEMEFGPHLLQALGARRQGGVDLIYSPPLKVSDFPDRKSLAKAAEDVVRSAMPKLEG